MIKLEKRATKLVQILKYHKTKILMILVLLFRNIINNQGFRGIKTLDRAQQLLDSM